MIRSAVLFLASSLAIAQGNSAPQSFTLKKITSSGSQRFSEADIIKATGLKPGDTITPDALKEAANRLMQSGVFAQVAYRYGGDAADFTVQDATQFVPVTFENFVWFTDAELIQRAHNSVPLFTGSVPLAGNLTDKISAALDLILKEKGVQGHATSMLRGKLAGQMQGMQYQVEGVSVKVAELHFPGAAPDRVGVLQELVRKVAGETYLQSVFTDVVKQNCPQIYGKLGFLKAEFGTPHAVIFKDDPAQPAVTVEIPVQEGDQYTFSSANFSGVSAISAAELAKMIEIKPGAIADTSLLAKGIAAAKDVYGTRGHMFAQIKSTATLDNEKHTAVFNLSVNEGPIYHMGKLDVQAPDAQRAELVKKVWDMHEGDVYDASYVKTFMKKHPRELSVLAGWAPHYTQTIHDDTHVVDLVLKFEKFQAEAR